MCVCESLSVPVPPVGKCLMSNRCLHLCVMMCVHVLCKYICVLSVCNSYCAQDLGFVVPDDQHLSFRLTS